MYHTSIKTWTSEGSYRTSECNTRSKIMCNSTWTRALSKYAIPTKHRIKRLTSTTYLVYVSHIYQNEISETSECAITRSKAMYTSTRMRGCEGWHRQTTMLPKTRHIPMYGGVYPDARFYRNIEKRQLWLWPIGGWNSTLQAAWYVRHAHWACLCYVPIEIIWCLWITSTIWLFILSSTSFTVGRSQVFYIYSSWKI